MTWARIMLWSSSMAMGCAILSEIKPLLIVAAAALSVSGYFCGRSDEAAERRKGVLRA